MISRLQGFIFINDRRYIRISMNSKVLFYKGEKHEFCTFEELTLHLTSESFRKPFRTARFDPNKLRLLGRSKIPLLKTRKINQPINRRLNGQQRLQHPPKVMHSDLVRCLLRNREVRIDSSLHLILNLLELRLLFIELVIPEAWCCALAVWPDGLADEELGEGRKNTHHDPVHVSENELVSTVVLFDKPECLNRPKEEAVGCIERE